jgi:transcriptional regulator with XRE-family HTH domain
MKDTVIIEARIILCKQLAEIAMANNLTQEEVSKKSGLTRNTINRLFQGKFAPTLDTYLRVCRAVDANIFIEDKRREISFCFHTTNVTNSPPIHK